RRPEAPRALDRIVVMCIAKNADERWQSAGDVKRALDLIDLTPVESAPAKRSHSARWYAAVLLAALSGLIINFVLRYAGNKASEPWTFRPLTYSGRASSPALSRDGKQVAFLWTGENTSAPAGVGGFDLYVQLVSGSNPLRLKDTQPRGRPAWSPDGTQI